MTGRPYTAGYADLQFVPAGSAVASRQTLLTTGTFQGGLAELAWSTGGDLLAAITTSTLGVESLWVLDEPARDATTISLSAPAVGTRGSALTVTGAVGGGIPMGTSLSVRRTDVESPDGKELAPVTIGESGAFSFTDQPPAGGTVKYTVSYAGDSAHRPSSAAVTVAVSRVTPALTLTSNGTVHAYGSTVTLTARLGSTHSNRTVELWADPAGADQGNRLLKRAAVDGAGNVTAALRLTRNTTVTATFAGDSRFSARSVKSTLLTRVAVTTAVSKHYRTAGGYHYFRKTKHPVFTTTMTPSANRKQRLIFEYYSAGKWRAWKVSTLPMSRAGKSVRTLKGTHRTGVKYRVRAAYLSGTSGDSLNYTTYGAWKYFTFRK
ncbi:hypothetical protein AB0M02_46500 [Actinoplanes sp. NPDC051861]|uniref:hypothetical protein n=1 Tax=Actinoplanes sp. NPDC051861 TaxID=3155170 RepID=UPI00341BE48C